MRELSGRVFVIFWFLSLCVVGYGNKPQIHANITQNSEIIVTVVNGRVRSGPSLSSTILGEMKIGTRLPKLDSNSGWYKVEVEAATETASAKAGWISKTISAEFDQTNPDAVFQEISDKYFKRKSLNFKTASQLFEFLGPAADDAKTFEVGGDLRLKRLLALSSAIANINYDQSERAPYKEFLTANKNDVIYHEPAGIWIVKSASFWELHNRYKQYKVGEKIAWQAAKNPLPGECEGYIVCHVNYLRVTSGEYLNFYPNGKYARQALTDISNQLSPMVADLPEKRNYTTVSDISDRAEFNRILSELRTIISKTPFVEKSQTLRQITRIAEGHR